MPFCWQQLSRILIDFQNSFGKSVKFPTKYLPHLRYVAALPWEVKFLDLLQIWTIMQTKCIFVYAPTLLHLITYL